MTGTCVQSPGEVQSRKICRIRPVHVPYPVNESGQLIEPPRPALEIVMVAPKNHWLTEVTREQKVVLHIAGQPPTRQHGAAFYYLGGEETKALCPRLVRVVEPQ